MLKGVDDANTHHWDDTTADAVSIRAWAMGSSAKYLAAFPATFTVDGDQSDADKLQAQDFLMAPARNIAHADEDQTLTFYHQLSQVTFRVKTAVPTVVSSVTLGSEENKLPLQGTFTAPAGTDTYGTWGFGSTTGVITPCPMPAQEGYVSVCSALVIPGDYMGKALVAVAATAGTFSFIPEQAAVLAPGGKYTFDVIVENDRIEVQLNSAINNWGQVGRHIVLTGN